MEETASPFKSFKESPEMTFATLAFLSYTVSLVCGLFPFGHSREFGPIEYYWESSTLWVLGGLFALYFLYVAFFDMWLHGLRLVAIYGLAGVGIMFATINYDDALYRFIGVAIIGIGGWQAFELMKAIWQTRMDKITSVVESDREEAYEKYSLGYWPFLPFIFFAASVFSFLHYALWYDGSPLFDDEQLTLGLYLMGELFIISVAIFILKIPQEVLFDEERVEHRIAMMKEDLRSRRIRPEEDVAEPEGKKHLFQLKAPTLLRSKGLMNPATLLSRTPSECPI